MNSDWQTSFSTIQDANLHMLESKEFSDVVFTIGENKEKIHAHKLILMSRSPVFAAMFSERWAANGASGDEEEGGIAIPDVSTDSFILFLEYVYSNKFSCETLDEASGVLCVAHKYNVRDLQDKCSRMLEDGISVSNAINFHQLALTLGLDYLADYTMEFILKNGKPVFGNAEFIKILPEVLTKVLSSDELCIDEVSAFRALMRWAENMQEVGCNGQSKREILGDLLYLIRFPNMTQKAFADEVVIGSPGILTGGEIQDIFMHFSGLPSSKLPVLPFNTKKRVRIASVMPYSIPSTTQGSTWNVSDFGEWNEEFMFIVDRDICITDIEIYPLFGIPSSNQVTLSQNFEVSIRILLESPLTELGYVRTKIVGSSCSERIQFREESSVNIKRSTSYKVELNILEGSFVLMHQAQPKLCPSVNVEPYAEDIIKFNFWSNRSYNSRHNAYYYNGRPKPNPVGHIKAIHFSNYDF